MSRKSEIMSDHSQIEEMKRYIFHEMSEEEYDAVEERYFDDSDYFNQLASLENDLVDRYACEMLTESDRIRFEKSIAKAPGRKDKIIKARALQNIIAEERSKQEIIAQPGFWEKFINLFDLRFALQYATAGLTLLLISLTGYLIYQNRSIKQELARQQELHNQEIAEKEKNQAQLNEANIQLAEAREEFEASRKDKETSRKDKEVLLAKIDSLTKEREILRNQQSQSINSPNNQNPKNSDPPLTQLATLIKVPGFLLSGGRSADSDTNIIKIKRATKFINVNLAVPQTNSAERFEISFQGKVFRNKRPIQLKSGKRYINITLPVQNLTDGDYEIGIRGNDSSQELVDFLLQRVK